MPRPPLSETSFLAHVFKPKTNPLPTGLRKSALKATKGRKVARVNAFNRMTALKQQIVKRSGMLEEYLNGTATFTDTKQRLRVEAVNRNVARPLRNRRTGTVRPSTKTDILARIADNIWRQTHGKRFTRRDAIDHNVRSYLHDPTSDMETWEYDTITIAATGGEVNGKRYMVFDPAGTAHNPFWYH